MLKLAEDGAFSILTAFERLEEEVPSARTLIAFALFGNKFSLMLHVVSPTPGCVKDGPLTAQQKTPWCK